MSRYNQYGYYYGPVGSQSQQPTGYTYQFPNTTSASGYPPTLNTSGYHYGGNTYADRQYGTAATQQAKDNASHAAAALSSLSSQTYNQPPSSSRSGASGQCDSANWYSNTGSASNAYGGNNMASPSRSQSNNSPPYATAQGASSFGRLTVPEQAESNSGAHGTASSYSTSSSAAAANPYQPGYSQPQCQPPRYNSLLQAVQAQQHGHSKQSSWASSHKPSPQMEQAVHATQQNVSRQQSASVEPSPTTVDPSQVYDNRAELQRKAQIETEKRRKHDAEQAAKQAEEERLEMEKRKAEEEKQKVEQETSKKAEQARKKKAREEKKQSKNAASALAKMASGRSEAEMAPPVSDEEAEIREMFKKMREFNSKNPAMLAKLWEEERKTHAQTQTQSPQAAKASSAAASKAPVHQMAASAVPQPATSPNQSVGMRPSKLQAGSAKANAPRPAGSPKAPQLAPAQSSSQTNTSLWPPHKKGALADATASWLRSQAQNANKTIDPQTVLNILDKNPSYVQLCESLEGLGLVFERAALARELLRAVPDGLMAQPTRKAASPSGSVRYMQNVSKDGKILDAAPPSTAGRTVSYETPVSISGTPREVNSMDRPRPPSSHGNQPTQSPFFAQTRPVSSGSRPPSQSQPPEIKPEIKPDMPPRPPADKEEASRKRTFSDLVDLTAEDSEDEPLPKRVMPLNSTPVNNLNVQQTAPSGQPMQPHLKYFMYTPNVDQTRAGFSASHMQSSTTPWMQSPGTTQPAQQAPIIPTQPPRPKGPTAEQQQQARLKGKMLVEPIMRDRVARKSKYDSRTIARDVLLATGRHPDMRGLNAHLSVMQRLLAAHGGEFDASGNRSDLATVRWNVIDPEPVKGGEVEKRPGTASSAEPVTVAAEALSTEKKASKKQATPAANATTSRHGTPTSVDAAGMKKRGRPPKSLAASMKPPADPLTNGLGTETQAPRQTTTLLQTTPSSAPAPKNNTTMSSGKSMGYTAFNNRNEDGTKKKGRPVGWRKNIHSREAQGLTPASLPSHLKEKRPVHTSAKREEQPVVQPQYQVYKCQWSGCNAELHNLDTLKKHIIKVHAPKVDEEEGKKKRFECWWKGCGAQTRHEGKVVTFEGIEDWIGHVQKLHLSPIAWKLGDGPRIGDLSSPSDSADPLPAYLFDEYGRAVTPVISPTARKSAARQADTAEGVESTPPPPPVVQRLGPGRPPKDGVSKAERDLSAPLKKLEEHQKVVGPTMDRMGCVLANEERRGRFLDDEDFEDEVEGSDFDARDEE